MKKLICYLAALVTLAYSCRRSEVEPFFNGQVLSGSINGKLWQNTNLGIGFLRNCQSSVDLSIFVFNEKGFLRESFAIFKIPIQKGVYPIKPHDLKNIVCIVDSTTTKVQASYSTAMDDGHVIKDFYKILEKSTEKNQLTITRIDTANRYIEGEFDVTFLLERLPNGEKHYADSPDTLRFSRVKFRSSIFRSR